MLFCVCSMCPFICLYVLVHWNWFCLFVGSDLSFNFQFAARCELFYMILNSGDELFLSYIHVVWLCHVQYVWWFINIVAVIFSCFVSWLVLHFWCMHMLFVFVWCCAAMYDGAAHFNGFMSYFGCTGIVLILDIVLISDLRGYSLF